MRKNEIVINSNPKRRKRVFFTTASKGSNAFGQPLFHNRYQLNTNDPWIPEIWANEAVRILHEQMIYPGTIHTDFNDEVANFGQTVHTRKPTELKAKRKQNDMDNLVDQDVGATDIEVKLDQRVYVSFLIGDLERSVTMVDLINEHLTEAMYGEARFIDRIVGGHVYDFLANRAGGLGALTKTNSHDYLLDTREVLNDNKVGPDNRWMGLASRTETLMQKNELFKSAERVGDGGQALRNALLGRVAGFNTFLELNTPSVKNATSTSTLTIDGAVGPGSTAMDVHTGEGASVVAGQYITVAGDLTPLRVTAISTDTLTVNRPTLNTIANDAAVTQYTTALVNNADGVPAGKTHASAATGYPKGWLKEIVYDGTGVPQIGQLVSFKLSGGTVLSTEYAIVDVDTTAKTILLNKALEDAIDDNAVICLGPSGDYNWAYQRNCMTMVNRALALPVSNSGVRSARGSFNGMSLRVNIAYDDKAEMHRVAISGLFGFKTLDTARGAVLLG